MARRKKQQIPATEVIKACAWCRTRIPPDAEHIAISARVRLGVDLRGTEGTAVPLALVSIPKTIYAIVPPRDSPARKDGKDLVFVVCSDHCGIALQTALGEDLQLSPET